jgi:hypothetical protein
MIPMIPPIPPIIEYRFSRLLIVATIILHNLGIPSLSTKLGRLSDFNPKLSLG